MRQKSQDLNWAADGKLNLTRLSGLWGALPELGLATILINILNFALPLCLMQIYDRIIPNQSISTLGLLVMGVITAMTLHALVKIARSHVTGWLGAKFEHKITCAAFRHLLNADMLSYEREGSSVYLERIEAASQIREFYSGASILALFDLPFVAVYLVVIALIGGWLVLVPMILLVAFLLAAMRVGGRLREDIRQRNTLDDRRFSFIADALSGVHSVKTMAMEALLQRRYERLQETNVNHGFQSTWHSLSAIGLSSTFTQITSMVVVAVGAVAVIDGRMTSGGLAACIMLSMRCLAPLQQALAVWINFQNHALARQRLEKIFALPSEDTSHKPPMPRPHGALRLENVSFRFPGSDVDLFSGMSISVAPGECIAISGESGTGKSTLLGLLAGLVRPTEGRVLVDGDDLADYAHASLAHQIGYLPQQGALFNGTILENMTVFDDSLEKQALDVAETLGLDRVVAGMRHGYDTPVGEGAAESMPAGIKQRIAIARALVPDPMVVLFDEANIAIDSAGDDLLREYLEDLRGKRTLILVTHRPSLLKMAERVLTLHNGRLVDHEQVPRTQAQVDFAAATVAGRALTVEDMERPPVDERMVANVLSKVGSASDLSVCLAGLLTALGWRGSPRRLAEALPHMVETLDLTGFRAVMANLNFKSEGFRADLADTDPRLLPALFLPDNGAAQVLLRWDADGLAAFDAETMGVVTNPDPKGKGAVYVFSPLEQNTAPNERASWVSRVVLRFHGMFWLGLVISVLLNILSLTTPLFVMVVYNSVVPSADLPLIAYLMAGLAIALTIDWLLRQLRGRILAYIAGRCEYVIGNSIFERILGLPATATERVTVGSQVSRIKDFESLREMFVGPVALLVYEMPSMLVFVVALVMLNAWLLAALLAGTAVYGMLALLAERPVQRAVNKAGRARTAMNDFVTDGLAKMRAIRLAGAEDIWYQRFRELSGRSVTAEYRAHIWNFRVETMAHMVGTLTGLATLVVSVAGVLAGTLQTGVVVATMMIMWRLLAPMQNGFMAATTLMRVLTSVRQIDNLMRLKGEREPTSASAGAAAPTFRGEVSFARVSFRYTNDADPALVGTSFTVEAGHVAAIAGPNGSGKSTMLKLMTRLYNPQAGSIRLDSVDIRQLDPTDLRTLVAYAPQQCDLLYGSVAQNLRLAHPTASDAELRWAARMAGVLEDVEALPKSFDTRIGDGGAAQLPIGFRQRLSLARAYLKPATVMLFDEPGNGLDQAGDQAFMRTIEYLRGGATIFIVSHRPSHMRLADTVIYLDQGYVRTVGPYEQVKRQMADLL